MIFGFGIATDALALIVCLASTLFMTGLVWFVQVVHYPLFAVVDGACFTRYHEAHTRATARVVLVPMVVELASSLVLIVHRPAGVSRLLAWAGLASATATWLSTVLVQIPMHEHLGRGFDPAVHRALVAGNAFRTACWTIHAAITLFMVGGLIP